MKLLKCHIENFGKLQNFDHSFDGNFDEIIQNNGWGKTTLATFIKAMFYGLPSTTKQKLDENERKKYTPWQGGNFGGYIDFEVEGDSFRIERFFGKKEAEDTFALTDLATGKPSAKYQKDIGIKLFDLDAEAYERSTFIPQKEIANGINGSISTKLINMIQGTANPESYERAIKILDDKATALKKKKGSTGKIDDVNAEIMQVSERIDTLKTRASAIDVLSRNMGEEESTITSLESEKQKVSARIADYSKAQTILANKKYIEENEQKQALLKQRIDGYKKVLSGTNITLDDLRDYTRRNVQLNESATKLQTLKDSDVYSGQYASLKSYFGGECPLKEEVEGEIQKCGKVQELKVKLQNLKTERQASQVVVQEEKPKKKALSYLLPLIFAVIGVIVGCVLISTSLISAVVLFIAAFVCLAVSGFMYMKNYIELKTSGNVMATPISTVSEDEIVALEGSIASLQGQVDEFICRYEKDKVSDPVSFLYDLLAKIKSYGELEDNIATARNKIQKLTEQVEELKYSLESFLAQFAFDVQLHGVQEKLDYLKAVVQNLQNDQVALKDIIGKLEVFKRQHSDVSGEAVVDVDITTLQSRERSIQNAINEHRENKNNYAHRIDEIRNDLSLLDELEERLEQLKGYKDELLKQHKTLMQAMKFLTSANDNLSSKYLSPMKNGINKYLKLVLRGDYENDMNIDTDLNVSFERYGKARGLDYLSKGYQEVVDISIRFALIDTLFSKEKPFIILDDPFVNMDKNKIQNALALLREFSKEYQLIYLVCHESRC